MYRASPLFRFGRIGSRATRPRGATIAAMTDDLTWARDHDQLLDRVNVHIRDWLDGRATRPVKAQADADAIARAFAEPLPEDPTPAAEVIDLLAGRAAPGLTDMGSGRFFGFVIGGTHPAALGADLLATTWDQNAGLRVVTPSAAVVEEVAGNWLKRLFTLPAHATVGFVTGGNMASFAGLAAGRHHVLKQHGWNVEELGLQGAPKLRVIASDERHVTIDASLRYLGVGSGTTQLVASDSQGRIDIAALKERLAAGSGPTLVCLAAGNVNTGAFDDFRRAIEVSHDHGAWVHVDGAFGLWAAASPTTQHLTSGVENADSWSTDAHKWLNVPYDSGIVIVAHPESHRETFRAGAAYLVQDAETFDPMELVPEFSRRARGFAVWAALRSMGRRGVAALGDRLCSHARSFAERLQDIDGCEVVNEVVLNQVLVRFDDDDHRTRRVVTDVVDSGVAYVGPTTFKGRAGMRISVSNGWTTSDDVEKTVEAIATALARRRGEP